MASSVRVLPAGINFNDRDYFRAQVAGNPGTYVSDARLAAAAGHRRRFFRSSRRLESPDGSFNGVISVAVRPKYFEDFYALIGQTKGSFFALVRFDGAYLARYPLLANRARRLSAASTFRRNVALGVEHGAYTAKSDIDGISRHLAFRKLPGYPVYALAGVTSAALRAEWISGRLKQLMVGVPAVASFLPCCGSRYAGPGASMTKPTGARWRKARSARRSAWKRSVN